MNDLNDIHIQVVDDEEVIRDLLNRSLEIVGCRVSLAEDGVQALEAIQTFRPDLIISDIKMPNMDGLTYVARAMEKYPGLPVLLITGYAESITAKAAYELGVSDLIIKPFRNAAIISSVKKALASSVSKSGA